MKITNREELNSSFITRCLNNATVQELLTLYSTSMQEMMDSLPDEEILNLLEIRGFHDLINLHFIDLDNDSNESVQEG